MFIRNSLVFILNTALLFKRYLVESLHEWQYFDIVRDPDHCRTIIINGTYFHVPSDNMV